MADLTSVLSQVIGEIRLVKAYGTESREAQAGEDRIYRMFRFGLQESRILALVGPISTFLLTAVLVIILGVGGVRVASGVLTAGDLVAFILLLFQVITPMAQFTTLYSRLQKVVGATERIQTILDHEEEPLELKQEAAKRAEILYFVMLPFPILKVKRSFIMRTWSSRLTGRQHSWDRVEVGSPPCFHCWNAFMCRIQGKFVMETNRYRHIHFPPGAPKLVMYRRKAQ